MEALVQKLLRFESQKWVNFMYEKGTFSQIQSQKSYKCYYEWFLIMVIFLAGLHGHYTIQAQ